MLRLGPRRLVKQARFAGRDRRLDQRLGGVEPGCPAKLTAGLGGVHQDRRRQGAVAHSSWGETKLSRLAMPVPRPTAGPGTRHRAPTDRAGDVADADLTLAGEVVGARRAGAGDRRGEGAGDVVVVDELDRDAGGPAAAARGKGQAGETAAQSRQRIAEAGGTGPACLISIVARGPATTQGRTT